MVEDPLFRRVKRHAKLRLRFADSDTSTDRLSQLKEYLRLENEMLQRYHRKGDTGLKVAKARSIAIDVMVGELYTFAITTFERKHGSLPCAVSLVALGGYGRQEVCPFSDIDIMFLYPDRVRKKDLTHLQETLTDEILYPLWDLNLKVGHSSRTIKEAVEEAKADIQTKNALLESRLVCGSHDVYASFSKNFEAYYQNEDPIPYFEGRLKDQENRRLKFGNTVFLQEPDIKNGVGGLRDYQNILWMARIRLGVGSLEELADKDFIDTPDVKALVRAYDFLMRTRNELHFQSKRPTDILDLEKQPRVAWSLGYRQRNIFKRVETFMRDYYRHAQKIYVISKLVERRLAYVASKPSPLMSFKEIIASRKKPRPQAFDGFIVDEGTLRFKRPTVFSEEPARLIRVFRHLQQYDAKLGWELSVLINQSLNLITPRLIADPGVKKTFRAIMQSAGQVHDALAAMHELGVLGRFIPEFAQLTCLVQHEYYHRYTADIHTLNTIAELDKIFTGETPNAEIYRNELRKTEIPVLLYLILLLHDIGKAMGVKNHSARGVNIARPILARLEVSPDYHERILLIIEHHLEMARFWQRFDIEDPNTAESFAHIVKEPDTLRYLFVHTFCDARGTAGSLWNSYKDALHKRLFYATLEYLKNEAATTHRQQERKTKMHDTIIMRKLPEISPEEIEAHFNLLPERYFLQNSDDEVELHIQMIHELLTSITEADSIGSLIPIIHWHDDIEQGLTIVNVVTWDRAGLFYKLAGALTVAGLNILSTKATCRSDHISIDTFCVVEPGGSVVRGEKRRQIFKTKLEDTLTQNIDLMPEILAQAQQKKASTSLLKSTTRLKAPMPISVDIYHELSLRRTIIEVQANDHIGLLYKLTKAIFDMGFNITFARISTERGAALDTFYIEKINGKEHQIPASQLVKLRDALNGIVAAEAC